ncbi:hypothetical protein SLEP1_g49195 [Rubroshorea leprosula]|uniref:Mitochondrial fission 1 protein n=1 Tax=Rubroshorea leprosula TaxID=152421 RepID=A0AAV5LYI3_9ROSI|nr:hypothetical protein SLEP1_g49195 [Rubroshorea leprosula]
MEAKIGRFLESVTSFFCSGDQIPWCDRDVIAVNVRRGIAMLEASLANSSSPLQQKEKLYLLAVGYYRCGDYPRSRQLVGQCLEMQPDWKPADALRKTVEDRIAKDGVIGIGITATALGLIAGGIAAALARKN